MKEAPRTFPQRIAWGVLLRTVKVEMLTFANIKC